MNTSDRPHESRPVAPGQMRVSDADRNMVIDLLNAAYAEGRITRDEHDQRVSKAVEARTFDDLVPLTSDLALPPSPVAARQPVVPTPQPETPSTVSSNVDTIYAIFSSSKRTGSWQVREHTSAAAVFGSVELDLTEAVFTCSVVQFNVIALFGSVTFKVPAGVRVRNEVSGILGESNTKRIAEPVAGAPTIVVKGMALLGEVGITGPK